MWVTFSEARFKKETWICRKTCSTVAVSENIKMEGIYLYVPERNQICLAGEELQFISAPHRQNHSRHNSANLNDIPEMTTSPENSLLFSSLYMFLSKPGYLYVNALNRLIINICFEFYLKLVMRLSDRELSGSLHFWIVLVNHWTTLWTHRALYRINIWLPFVLYAPMLLS